MADKHHTPSVSAPFAFSRLYSAFLAFCLGGVSRFGMLKRCGTAEIGKGWKALARLGKDKAG
jgi:hypothetical protein